MPNQLLFKKILPLLPILSESSKLAIEKALDSLKPRCHLINDIAEMAKIYIIENEVTISAEARAIIDASDPHLIDHAIKSIEILDNLENISDVLKQLAEHNGLKIGELMKPLRALLTGMSNSPSVFEIINLIGKDATIKRLRNSQAFRKL
jgi:glutamyl-tRNA synthetase